MPAISKRKSRKPPSKAKKPAAKAARRPAKGGVRLSFRDLEAMSVKPLPPTTEKEQAIIDAAVVLLGERGIDGATTAEIARRAGVTERTLFRYFPSKQDLIQRVMFPMLRGGLLREWQVAESLLKTDRPSFKDWYVAFTTDRIAMTARHVPIGRTILLELAQDPAFRAAVEPHWRRHILEPMLQRLADMKAKGGLRADVDLMVLARAIHCMNVGYFFVRRAFNPDAPWDDTAQIEQMADLLARGAAA